jgi:hypothetical protein
MSNIRKQFNFRNGVQVDDDNFIVSSTGLVGIGTTIPTESLDLYGNAKISGFATATELRAQTLVVSQTATIENITFNNSIIGSGVSIRSGVISATSSSGIVTYFGDARFLQGMPTSQWLDIDVGLGFTSIYAAGFVGVGTVDPRFPFQVAGNTSTTLAGFANGVGISSSGDILATGIVTASSFSGNLTGNVTGNVNGTINTTGISTLGVTTATNLILQQLNVSGLSTFAGITTVTGPTLFAKQLNVSGVSTFSSFITAPSLRDYNSLVGTASSTTTTFVVTVAAKTTNHRYYGTGSANAYVIDGIESPFITLLPGKTYRFTQEGASNSGHPLRFYYEAAKTTQYSTNVTTSGTPGTAGAYTEIVVTDTTPVVLHYQCSVHGYMGNAAQFNSNVVDTPYQITTSSGLSVTGVSTFTGASTFANTVSFAGITTITGSTLFTQQLGVSGVATISTRLYVESIGVGTNSPSSDIHIRRSSASTLQVTSDTAAAIIAVGRSTTLEGNNGAIIFGNTAGIYPYSDSRTLDIVNYDTGNINQYLDYGSIGVGTGNFNWICGQDPTSPLMSLTYQGNLGVGVTDPTVKFQVSGIASVTSLVTGDITATGNIVATGAATSTSVQTLYVYGGKSEILNPDGTSIFPPVGVTDNVNATSGISTFFDINVTNNAIIDGNIGIGTTNPQDPIQVGSATTDGEYVTISEFGVGLGTAANANGFFLDGLTKEVLFGAVSIGNTNDVLDIPTNHLLYVEGNSEFNGNVGIGTTLATSKLHVIGGANITGVTTSQNGFTSGIGVTNPVKITVSGNILSFTVAGVGSTSLILY